MLITFHKYLPWTTTKRSLLAEFVRLTLKHGLSSAEEQNQKSQLYQDVVVHLADVLLNGYLGQLESFKDSPYKITSVERSFTCDRKMQKSLGGPKVGPV